MNSKRLQKLRFSPYTIAIVPLVLFAAFLRLRGAVFGYFAFTFDPGRDLLVVRDLVVNHKMTLIGPFSGLSGVFYGPWWYWILSIPFVIGSGDPRVIAEFIAVANLLVPIGIYLLGKKMGSAPAGLIGALLVTLSPLFIGYSSQIWNPNLVPPLTMGALVLWFSLVSRLNQPDSSRSHKRESRSLIMSRMTFLWVGFGVLLGLIINFQISFGLAFLFSLLPWFAYVFFTHKQARLGLLGLLGGMVLTFLPLIFFDLRHQFLESKAILSYLEIRPIRSHDYNSVPVREKLVNRFDIFKSRWLETFNSRLVYLTALVVILLGGFLAFWRRRGWDERRKADFSQRNAQRYTGGNFFYWLLTSLGFIFIFFMLYPDTVWDYYLVGLPVIFITILVAALSQIFQKLGTLEQHFSFAISVFVVIFFLFPFKSIPDWLGQDQTPWLGDGSVFRNQLTILDYIYQDAGNKEISVMVYTPPVYDYHYQYLFQWYGKKKYGRVPGKKPQGNLYLIMEPDSGHPWLWEGWIKTVVKEAGKVASRKEFPGGVVVEKRVID